MGLQLSGYRWRVPKSKVVMFKLSTQVYPPAEVEYGYDPSVPVRGPKPSSPRVTMWLESRDLMYFEVVVAQL